MHNVLAESCPRAHFWVRAEVGNSLIPDNSHSQPADILLSNWVMGKPAAFDLSVTPLANSSILLETGVTAGRATLSTEQRKHSANDGTCNELGWIRGSRVIPVYWRHLEVCHHLIMKIEVLVIVIVIRQVLTMMQIRMMRVAQQLLLRVACY